MPRFSSHLWFGFRVRLEFGEAAVFGRVVAAVLAPRVLAPAVVDDQIVAAAAVIIEPGQQFG